METKRRYKRRSTPLGLLPSPLPDFVCGIDEAGRGPLAGPVVASSVIFPTKASDRDFYRTVVPLLADSKKLSTANRTTLFNMISDHCDVGIGIKSAEYIDTYGIKQSTHDAMLDAIMALSRQPTLLLIDGNDGFDFTIQNHAVIQGDAHIAQISAASIIAKVTRDTIMYNMDQKYPEYCFAQHKGYGTKKHRDLIARYGLSKIHRTSFCRTFAT